MLCNLWVKDNCGGRIHQIGTDTHDSLIYINGKVEYRNLQNGDGTPYGYSFIEPPDMRDYVSVEPDQLFLNRELIHKDLHKEFEKYLDKYFEDEDEELYDD